MKTLYITLLSLLFTIHGYTQGCQSAINLGVIDATQTCVSGAAGTGSGAASCNGGGFGGNSWTIYYVEWTTGPNNDCTILDVQASSASNVTMATYTGCSGTGAVSGYVGGSVVCSALGDGSAQFSSTTNDPAPNDIMTQPNTTYYTRIAVENGGTIDICAYTQEPVNDDCSGATTIDGTTTQDDNYCMTEGTTDPAPVDWCAGSLENTAWYTFTAAADGTATITIENIVCSGGGAGFQIGYWVGSCTGLNNIGCSSGSGGTVTATISNLTAGDVVYIGMDGNAGANCNYGVSVTNSVPLPVELISFNGEKQGNSNELTWVTASEKNNDYFILEYSPNGKDWKEIQKIDGAGSSSTENTYGTTHRDFEAGVNYYRLKQVDFDGTVNTHNIISINNTEGRVLLKRVNSMGQEVNDSYNGMVIEYYDDGSTRKVMQ